MAKTVEVTLPFEYRDYQLPFLQALEHEHYKRFMIIWARRAGKDIVAFNAIIRQALKKPQIIYYIFPTYRQGKRALFDSMTNDGRRFIDFIPQQLIKSINSVELKITLINNSQICVVGSNNPDALRGSNPQICVFSEWAMCNPESYNILSPVLLANQGKAIFLSCVAPDTIVITSDGMQRIENVSDKRSEYNELNIPVFGLGGFHTAEQFYYGGKQQTKIITLQSGYKIECTSIHKLWNGSSWVVAGELKLGDILPIQYNQQVFGKGIDFSSLHLSDHGGNKPINFDLTSLDFFYFLGLMHADGNYDKNKVCITKKKDPEIIEFLRSYGFITRADGIHHEYSNKNLCRILEFLNFKHGAKNKELPDSLLKCTREQLIAFLQGLFDGDGCSHSNPSKRGRVAISSSCEKFIRDLQILLLNFGVVGSIRKEFKNPTTRVKVHTVLFILEINGYFAHIFYRDIGFRLPRKQKNLVYIVDRCKEESGSIYPVDLEKYSDYKVKKSIITNTSRVSRRLIKQLHQEKPHPYFEQLLSEYFFYSPIVSIEEGSCEVFDFVIPETHSFFSNGFISHNTPRGKNFMYDQWNIVQNDPEWFTQILTVKETKHISEEEIEKERVRQRKSQDWVLQEYHCSWNYGIEGSFYGKYIDKMKLNGQIGTVPWSPLHKVWTAWDLGLDDYCCVTFFQIVNNNVHVIDCIVDKDRGLDYYCSEVLKKEYIYGGHIGPHDINVREFGSGAITRKELAAQMGIHFEVCPVTRIEDGIEAVRAAMSRMFIDEVKCRDIIAGLEGYQKDWDESLQRYKNTPVKNWTTDVADSIRYMCQMLPLIGEGMTAQDAEDMYNQALYGRQPSTINSPYSRPIPGIYGQFPHR